MASKQVTTSKNEPMIVKAFHCESDKLIKEGVNSGLVEEFVVLPGVWIKQLCNFGNDVVFAYQSKSDQAKGGMGVFDPSTKKLKQHIETLAVDSCANDKDCLVAGGYLNGMVYIFQYENNELQLIKSTQLHESDATALGVAINTSMNKLLSVGTDKEAIVTDLKGTVISQRDLPHLGYCVNINNVFSVAFVGCKDGSIVIIDFVNSTDTSTIETPGGTAIYSIATQDEKLITGSEDNQIIIWKITRTSTTITLTQTWIYQCKHSIHLLYLYSNKVFANVHESSTIAINIDDGQLYKKYSKTQYSYALVVIGDDDVPSTLQPISTTANPTENTQALTLAKTQSIPTISAPAQEVSPRPSFSSSSATSSQRPSTKSNGDPNQFTRTEVAEWLECVDLSEFASMFRANFVDGKMLRTLTNEELASIGINQSLVQKRILTEIAQLFGQQKDSTLTRNTLSSTSVASSSTTPMAQPTTPKAGILNRSDIKIIGKAISDGAFADVFKGDFCGRTVAIKEMKRDCALNKQLRDDFEREGCLGFFLSHNNIVRTYGVCMDYYPDSEIYPCIVLELLSCSLRNKLDDPAVHFSEAMVIEMFSQISKAISSLHAQSPPIIHCDIKPENIMLMLDEMKHYTPKLIDFGLAEQRRSTVTHNVSLQNAKGTYGYMAPEVHRGELTQYADVFAIGMVLYEVLTKKRVFPSMTNAKIQAAVEKGERPSSSDVPQKFRGLLEKCWSQDVKSRYKMADVAVFFEELLHPTVSAAANKESVSIQLTRTTAELAAKLDKVTQSQEELKEMHAKGVQVFIAHLRNLGEHAYPVLYFVCPQKPRNLLDKARSIFTETLDCYCCCEFQCSIDGKADPDAMWHPVNNDDGTPFKVPLKEPKTFVKKLAPVLKIVYVGLKVGVIGAKLAGVPVPDLSQLVPDELLHIEGSIVSALQAAEISTDDLLSKAEETASSIAAPQDAALIQAVHDGSVAGSKLRPKSLNAAAVAMLQQVFPAVLLHDVGPLHKCSIEVDGSPFGSRGTVLWLCKEHRAIVEDWNDGNVQNMTEAIKKAQDSMKAVEWPQAKYASTQAQTPSSQVPAKPTVSVSTPSTLIKSPSRTDPSISSTPVRVAKVEPPSSSATTTPKLTLPPTRLNANAALNHTTTL